MARTFTMILGVVLLLIGVAGFITGGHDHDLLVFGINTTHNVVHALSGVVALLAANAGERPARIFCLVFGAVYGLVALAGFLNVEKVVRLLNLNRADDFLHVSIAAACLITGFVSARRMQPVV
jgi:Domain of unknown function (DUF4383)